jgi:poly-gamma-glutamate synthesis protein (capsule biosynthesis protein)
MRKIPLFFGIIILLIILSFSTRFLVKEYPFDREVSVNPSDENDEIKGSNTESLSQDINAPIEEEKVKIITITAIGDCTIGSFPEVTPGKSFHDVMEKNNFDPAYPFKNAFKWTFEDDITIINFEGALTNETKMANKKWRFKGPPEYVEILTESSIEAVCLANNHSRDYLEKGYEDTISIMESAGIGAFGDSKIYVHEVNGVKVGLIGYMAISESEKVFDRVRNGIDKAKELGSDIIICSFHWGIEYTYSPTKYQRRLGRFAIDYGADMVIGHHPHVLQGIELYKDRYIAYSLGNFVFGGNEVLTAEKHKDIDTMILRKEFEIEENSISRIKLTMIPFKLSGDLEFNNYQPVVQKGAEALRIRDKVLRISKALEFGIKDLEIEY